MSSLSPTWRGQARNARRLLDSIEEHAAKLDAVEVTHPDAAKAEERRTQLNEQIANDLEGAAVAVAVAQAKWGQRA